MSTEIEQKDYNQLRDRIHGLLRKAGVSEENKPVIFAGCMLAVRDATLLRKVKNPEKWDVALETRLSIERVLDNSKIFSSSLARWNAFLEPFKVIQTHKALNSALEEGGSYLSQMLTLILDSPLLMSNSSSKDVIADFYTEFLRWSGGDGSGLGIVLTPKHITDLFAEAGISLLESENKTPIILDNSFGGGSFLKAGASRGKKITGIELNPKMYSLGTTSLILLGADVNNLFEGDAFNKDIHSSMSQLPKTEQPNLALINPPYALRKNGGKSEIEFIENACNLIVNDGYVFALVPISTGASLDKHSAEVRERILEQHSLYAVMSMPTNLFISKAGTMVQILVFKTGTPHKDNKTWFADWSEDGFILQKHVGREDYNGDWSDIKKTWLSDFAKRRDVQGKSTLRNVGLDDAWVTEEYLRNDLSNLTANAFSDTKLKLDAYELNRNRKQIKLTNDLTKDKNKWGEFPLMDLFSLQKGDYTIRGTDRVQGDTPLVSASAENNGITAYVQQESKKATLFPADSLTIAQNGSVGATFLQLEDFYASSDVGVLRWIGNSFKTDNEQKNVLLFICTVLETTTKGRFHYGFKLNNQRLNNLSILLPTIKENIDVGRINDFMKQINVN